MRYKVFGRHTGLRVSELFLGAGMFGTGWGHGAEPEESRCIFDGYLEAGGNVLDTSDSYQFGESESLLGEFIGSVRDDLIVATKYTQSADPKGSLSVTGNSRKAMVRSLEQSLKRLRTDRIDLYWVHMPDDMTPIDEIVRGLDDLVRAGKVLYAGSPTFQRGERRLLRCSLNSAAGHPLPHSKSSTVWCNARRSGNCCQWPPPSASRLPPGHRSVGAS